MPDKKISQLTERLSAVLGTDLLAIVGNTATTPTNYRVQVKNFLSQVLVDLPQTTLSAFSMTANVSANAVGATLAAAELILQANAASGFTVQDRVGLIARNLITGANSNVTGRMWGAHVQMDPGTSNFVAANAFGVVIEHTIANTAQARLVSPRAYLGIKEQAGASGNATSYLMDVGAQGNTVSANITGGDPAVVYSRANNYSTGSTRVNRTLKISVNGEDLWLHASNVAPNNSVASLLSSPTDGVGQFLNAAGATFTRLILGANDATVNGLGLVLNSGGLRVTTGDGSAFSALDASVITGRTALVGPGTTAATGDLRLQGNGWITGRNSTPADALILRINTADNFVEAAGANTTGLRAVSGFQVGSNKLAVSSAGLPTVGNGLTLAGFGWPLIPARGRATAQTAANASITTYTPAADGTLEISGQVLVTTATSHSFSLQVSYTDENNTARTQTIPMWFVGGSAWVTTIANANGAVPYFGSVVIRAKAATAVTVLTSGTFTTVTYNVEATIKQTA